MYSTISTIQTHHCQEVKLHMGYVFKPFSILPKYIGILEEPKN